MTERLLPYSLAKFWWKLTETSESIGPLRYWIDELKRVRGGHDEGKGLMYEESGNIKYNNAVFPR
jgi:hypothetical protein